MSLAAESSGKARQALYRQIQNLSCLDINSLHGNDGEPYEARVLSGVRLWYQRIITHINSQQRIPSIGENLCDEFGNPTRRAINDTVFASFPVELRDAYLCATELQLEYDESTREEQ